METIRLNVRAMLALMRGVGLEIEAYEDEAKAVERRKAKLAESEAGEEEIDDVDMILTEDCREERWLRVDIY